MSESPTVTNASAFKEKSLAIQVLLTIVTAGLYTVYWLYSTASQLDEGTDASLIPILGILPVLNIVTVWQIASAGEAVSDQSKILVFILFVVFPPVSWYLVQSGMNDTATN